MFDWLKNKLKKKEPVIEPSAIAEPMPIEEVKPKKTTNDDILNAIKELRENDIKEIKDNMAREDTLLMHDYEIALALESILPGVKDETNSLKEVIEKTPVQTEKAEFDFSVIDEKNKKEAVYFIIDQLTLRNRTPYARELERLLVPRKMSRATLYRVLKSLVEEGRITQGGLGEKSAYVLTNTVSPDEKQFKEYLEKNKDTETTN